MSEIELKCRGVGREPDEECALTFYFSRKPSDDEMRCLHDALRGVTTRAPAPASGGALYHIARDIAEPLDKAINATFEEDPTSAETIKEILWDNKIGILRVLQSVASPAPSAVRTALVKARKVVEGRWPEHPVEVDTLLEEIDAALSAPQGTEGPTLGEWLPIETAPKDGTDFLAFLAYGYITRARYINGRFFAADSMGTSSSAPPHDTTATHWMPLPPPPTGAK